MINRAFLPLHDGSFKPGNPCFSRVGPVVGSSLTSDSGTVVV